MLLSKLRDQVNHGLEEVAERIAMPGPLGKGCQAAILSPGKRIRPILALLVADALDMGYNVLPAALSVELFHAASLVADDLPCMDDDDIRRGAESLHRSYGETLALLVTYALIAEGYGLIAQNASELSGVYDGAQRAGLEFLSLTAKNTGASGLVGGQLLDLHPPARDVHTLRQILSMKTATLFEQAFCAGWLFGGGDFDKLSSVKALAGHYGLAFQIADDLDDLGQDRAKETGVNLAVDCGEELALKQFDEEVALYRAELRYLGLETLGLVEAIELLEANVTNRV